jgi:hypothetical protein
MLLLYIVHTVILQQNFFNLAPDSPALLIAWHLMKVAQRPEVLLSVTSSACTDSKTLSWVIWTLFSPSSCNNGLKRPKDE